MEKILYFNSMIEPKGGVFSVPVIIALAILVSLIILIIILTFGLIDSIKNTTFTLTGRELIIKSFFYGKKIPIENILIDEIKAVNLNETQEYAVAHRINGMYLPNVLLGWMRLKSGQKALTYITDKNSVVVVPTKEYVILFSMNNTEEFIEKIKTAGK